MRVALLATGAMNLCGCLMFVPPLTFARRLLGLPEPHPFYLWLLATWIGAFGIIYLWLGVTGRPDRAFLTIAAIGKLSFWGLLCIYWLAGEFPVAAPIASGADLVFGLLFTYWLLRARPESAS